MSHRSPAERLQTLLKLRTLHERESARDAVSAGAERDQHQLKLDELVAYRNEYSGEAGLRLRPDELMSSRQFLSQLSVAIDQQEAIVEASVDHAAVQEAAWLDAIVHRKSMEKLVDKRSVKERLTAAKREQAEQDDIASRAAGFGARPEV